MCYVSVLKLYCNKVTMKTQTQLTFANYDSGVGFICMVRMGETFKLGQFGSMCLDDCDLDDRDFMVTSILELVRHPVTSTTVCALLSSHCPISYSPVNLVANYLENMLENVCAFQEIGLLEYGL
jgi:hypothetical protein